MARKKWGVWHTVPASTMSRSLRHGLHSGWRKALRPSSFTAARAVAWSHGGGVVLGGWLLLDMLELLPLLLVMEPLLLLLLFLLSAALLLRLLVLVEAGLG